MLLTLNGQQWPYHADNEQVDNPPIDNQPVDNQPVDSQPIACWQSTLDAVD